MAVLVADGLSPFEFAVACEVFGYDRSATLGVPWYRFSICTAEPGPVMTQVGFTIDARGSLRQLEKADVVVVPPIDPPGGSFDERLLDSLRRAHRNGARMVSLCTGAFLLAAAGILDGRQATTHWSSAGRLAARYPAVRVDPKVLYVDTGDVVTSAGSAASIDCCLHLVQRDLGAEVANTVARNLVVAPHRDGGQAQYVATPLPTTCTLDTLGPTLAWAQERLDQNLNVNQLAERAAMSPRTFARRFVEATGTTPHRWLCRQRVLLAQRLLETTDLGVDHIADRCGLGTAANLRLHFREELGVSPGAYRRTFRHRAAA